MATKSIQMPFLCIALHRISCSIAKHTICIELNNLGANEFCIRRSQRSEIEIEMEIGTERTSERDEDMKIFSHFTHTHTQTHSYNTSFDVFAYFWHIAVAIVGFCASLSLSFFAFAWCCYVLLRIS